MNVFLANEQDTPVDETRLSKLARHVLTAEKMEEVTELSILLVTSGHIRRLNARFAGNDYPTDVLSFPMMEDGDVAELLGDVVICPQVAATNAEKLGHSVEREMDTLLVHGTLHLLGYDHQGEHDTPRMEGRLAEILESFGAPTPT